VSHFQSLPHLAVLNVRRDMPFVRQYTSFARQLILCQVAELEALARETMESVKKWGAWVGSGAIWNDDRPNLLQAIDPANGSTPRESDGDPPDPGLRFRCIHRSSTADLRFSSLLPSVPRLSRSPAWVQQWGHSAFSGVVCRFLGCLFVL
jgi:hypothetical protein